MQRVLAKPRRHGKAGALAPFGDCTAEARRARSEEFLIQKFSELCELCASVVNSSSQWSLGEGGYAIRIHPRVYTRGPLRRRVNPEELTFGTYRKTRANKRGVMFDSPFLLAVRWPGA